MEPFTSCALTLRVEIPEPDEADAATIIDGDRPAGAARAGRPALREGLAPSGIRRQHFADSIGAGRQTREQVVARGVGHGRRTDRAVELDAPARETGVQPCINEHLAVDRRGTPERW